MIAATLARVEWLKTRKRRAFWYSAAFFVLILTLGFGIDYYEHARNPARQTGASVWDDAAAAGGSLGLMVVIIVVVLLTASEKTWRTERQNVIDGLSRDQYFAGKAMLVTFVAFSFWILATLYGGVFSVLERGLVDTPSGPFFGALDAKVMAGLLLSLTVIGCIALFFGSVASSSGAALALVILFLMSQPWVMGAMADRGGAWQEATAFLPIQVIGSLTDQTAYEPPRFAELLARWRERGAPLQLPGGTAALFASLYGALLAGGAWWSVRSRDL